MSFPTLSTGSGLQAQPVHTPTTLVPATGDKPKIFLTTVRIPDDHIWANGLFQNVYVIYKMLEILGYEPWLMVDNNQNNKDAKIHEKFRMIDFKEYTAKPFQIVSYIEMGMSCDPSIRRFFRSMGSKVSKLYLGNILNIDIETITYYSGVNFSHHVAGELDEIWVSPHYDIHAEYAGSINGMHGKTRIAPYVWDPMFIEDVGVRYDEAGLTEQSPRQFVIMEPNISFQKNSLIPILAAEAYFRKHPTRVDTVIVINGAKLKENPYFQSSVLPNLTIFTAGKLQLMPRAHIVNIVKVFRQAIILQHQVNNEYNYSFLEFQSLGFPVVHNVSRFAKCGYYYPGNDFDQAANQIETIVKSFGQQKETINAQIRQIAWDFSIYNPANLEAWRKLVTKA
jgi:hypothetical protein